MEYLIYLVIIAAVIILSQISLYLSKRIGIQGTVIAPLIIGFILNALLTKDKLSIDLNELTPIFLTLAGISLIFFVFDSSAKVGIKDMDTSHSLAFKLFAVTFILNLFALTFFTNWFTNASVLSSILFALAFTSTSPIFFNDWESKIRGVLSKEAIIATPILLVLGYFIYDIIAIQNGVPHFFAPNITPYFLELLVGVGVGAIVAIVFFNTIRLFYKNNASITITMLTALFAYLLTEFLGGDGVSGVAVFALFFGNMHLENKEKTTRFFEKTLNPMMIILILILGFTAGFNISAKLFLDSITLLFAMLIIRFISASLIFGKGHTIKEKLHLTLNTQHGASLIIILLLLALRGFFETSSIVQISMLLLIYTAVISSLASLYDHKDKIKEKAKTNINN